MTVDSLLCLVLLLTTVTTKYMSGSIFVKSSDGGSVHDKIIVDPLDVEYPFRLNGGSSVSVYIQKEDIHNILCSLKLMVTHYWPLKIIY